MFWWKDCGGVPKRFESRTVSKAIAPNIKEMDVRLWRKKCPNFIRRERKQNSLLQCQAFGEERSLSTFNIITWLSRVTTMHRFVRICATYKTFFFSVILQHMLSDPQVVYSVGLCICLYDITKLEDSYIFPGDGASHTKGMTSE